MYGFSSPIYSALAFIYCPHLSLVSVVKSRKSYQIELSHPVVWRSPFSTVDNPHSHSPPAPINNECITMPAGGVVACFLPADAHFWSWRARGRVQKQGYSSGSRWRSVSPPHVLVSHAGHHSEEVVFYQTEKKKERRRDGWKFDQYCNNCRRMCQEEIAGLLHSRTKMQKCRSNKMLAIQGKIYLY